MLKGAAGLLVLTGLGLLAWLLDKTLLHPWERVADDLVFWVPFVATILIGVAALAYLFTRAARRVEAGEDLFAHRHRRRPEPSSSD
ncbi:hypothetical protein AWN76_004650 [Rhodothermaceae bacterium RA]|nr:hypothetical protein AWN76_004650 [Rhodothermaceae bacterium RA]